MGLYGAQAAAIKKTTTYSRCSRADLSIIVAMETLSERSCKTLGQKKSEHYALVGWKCVGKNNEEGFSCETEKASSFAYYKGIKLDHLTFTNLHKHRSLVAYINANSNKICHADRDELVSAKVKDAVCHKRK